MPTVSVIIPCYNQGRYLDEAVTSVLNQTFRDVEILVIDDGSTDPLTRELLKAYHRPRTRIIRTSNRGVAAARNTGIAEASGPFILPLDADDAIAPDYLRQAIAVVEEADPGVGVVYSRADRFGAQTGPWEIPEYRLEEMLINNLIFCAGLFRKEDWERTGGYDPGFSSGWEDYDFWLSLIGLGKTVHRLPEVLFHYRIRPDSMIRSISPERMRRMRARICRKHRGLYETTCRRLMETIRTPAAWHPVWRFLKSRWSENPSAVLSGPLTAVRRGVGPSLLDLRINLRIAGAGAAADLLALATIQLKGWRCGCPLFLG